MQTQLIPIVTQPFTQQERIELTNDCDQKRITGRTAFLAKKLFINILNSSEDKNALNNLENLAKRVENLSEIGKTWSWFHRLISALYNFFSRFESSASQLEKEVNIYHFSKTYSTPQDLDKHIKKMDDIRAKIWVTDEQIKSYAIIKEGLGEIPPNIILSNLRDKELQAKSLSEEAKNLLRDMNQWVRVQVESQNEKFKQLHNDWKTSEESLKQLILDIDYLLKSIDRGVEKNKKLKKKHFF